MTKALGLTGPKRLAIACTVVLLGACVSTSPSASPSAPLQPSHAATPTAVASEAAPGPGWDAVSIDDFHIASIAEGSLIVAVGETRDFAPVIATSQNGEAWERTDLTELLGKASLDLVVAGRAGFVVMGVPFLEDPAGIPDPFLLHSADGRSWEIVPDPEPCSWPMSGAWTTSGYTILGGRCRNEGDFDPRPIRVLTSYDGRSWASATDFPEFADPHRYPGPIMTDGARLVASPGIFALDADTWIWISEDGGMSWRTLMDAVADNVSLEGGTYGHGQFVAQAHRLIEVGNVEAGSCASTDGESWECRFPGPVLPHLAATATGYASLDDRLRDPLGAIEEIAQVTSTDGATWEETVLEDFGSTHHILGTAATSRGLFAWGYLRNDEDTLTVGSFLLVHRAPLP